MSHHQPRLPVEDLARYLRVDGLRANRISEQVGVPARTVERWKVEGGVPFRTAERVAGNLREHPAVIWDGWLDLSTELAERQAS